MRILVCLFPLLLTLVSCDTQPPKKIIHTPLHYETSLHTMQGQREYMEDRHTIYTTKNCMVVAVFDGHGGSKTAEWLKKELPQRLVQTLKKLEAEATIGQQRQAIIQCYKNLDEQIFHKQKAERKKSNLPQIPSDTSGSTAVVYLAIKDPDKEKREMLINLGDSRAIVIGGNEVIVETTDHKPNNPIEKSRIKRNGGKMDESYNAVEERHEAKAVISCKWEEGRGALRTTRAFGDFHFKVEDQYSNEYFSKWISAEPDVSEISTEPGDYMVLASDGFWDTMSSDEAAGFVAQNSSQHIAKALAKKAHSISAHDNISVIVLRRAKGKESYTHAIGANPLHSK